MLVSSCIGELQSNKRSDNAVMVRINMQVPQQKNVLTRTQTLSENESTVNDMTVLIFNADNKLIGYSYSATPTPTNNIYQMTVNTREATGCTVYVVANAGANAFTTGNSTVSGVSNPVNTLDEFTMAYTKLSTASDLGSQSNVIMSGVLKNQDITASTQTLATTVPLYRLCTKINFNINPSSDIKITGYQLHQVPTSSYITDRSTETTPAYNPSNSYKDFDKVTESSPTNGSEVTSTYYIYENLAGTASGSNTAKTRNSTNAPATASYLDVYATGPNWQSTYRIYLGGTGTTDYTNYNIPRNYNYTYTINITASGVYDVRVTCYPELINSSTGGTWSSGGSATAVTSSATATPGDYYFSDGTWGTLANRASATVYPIGVVFSGTTSANDKARGWTHGYAIALTNASTNTTTKTCIWGPEATENTNTFTDSYGTYTYNWYNGEYYSSFITDKDGYCETQTIKRNHPSTLQTSYPAFYYALNYAASGTTYAAPSGSSGWFLPSIGQWYDIFANLGGITSASIHSSEPGYCYWNGVSSSAASSINSYLNKITAYNKSYSSPDLFSNSRMPYGDKAGNHDGEYYWSSSEYDSTFVGHAIFIEDDNLYLYYYHSKATYFFRVRCAIAF